MYDYKCYIRSQSLYVCTVAYALRECEKVLMREIFSACIRLHSSVFKVSSCNPLDISRVSIHPRASVNSRQFRVPSANPCN